MRSLVDFVRRILGMVASEPMKRDRCKRLITCIRREDRTCCRDLEAGRHAVARVQAEREIWSM
jgi:hypothetical protein